MPSNDVERPCAAPPHFPFDDHRTMQEVMDEQCLEWLCYGFSRQMAAKESGLSLESARSLQATLAVF